MKSIFVAWTLLAAPILVSTAVVRQVANPAGPVGIPGPNKQPNPSAIPQVPTSVGVGFQGNWEAYAGGFQNGTHYLVPLPHGSGVPSQKRAVEPVEVAPKPEPVAPKPATPKPNGSPGTSESDPNNPSGPIQVNPDGKPNTTSGKPGTSSGDDTTTCKRSADGSLGKRCPGGNGDGDEDAGQSVPNPENLQPAPDRKTVKNWITDVAKVKPGYQFTARESRDQRIKDNADDKPLPGIDAMGDRNYKVERTNVVDITKQSATRSVAEMIRDTLKIEFKPAGKRYVVRNNARGSNEIAVNSYSEDGKIMIHEYTQAEADKNPVGGPNRLRNSDFTIQQHREVTENIEGGMNNLKILAQAEGENPETLATAKTAYELKKIKLGDHASFDATAAPGTDDYIICEGFLRSDNGNADLWTLGDAQRSYQGRGIKSIETILDKDGVAVQIAYVLEDAKPATGAHT